MILTIRKIIFVFIILKFKSYKNLSFIDLNFRQIDFTNYKHVKSYIFKKDFYTFKNKNIHNFDFLNFSNNLGGKIGISLSKESIFGWFNKNKYKLNFPWSEDLSSKRLINLLYNYENVYTGDFIKALLKVINICKEYEIICNTLNQFELLQKKAPRIGRLS